jgi:hypothetical protein
MALVHCTGTHLTPTATAEAPTLSESRTDNAHGNYAKEKNFREIFHAVFLRRDCTSQL